VSGTTKASVVQVHLSMGSSGLAIVAARHTSGCRAPHLDLHCDLSIPSPCPRFVLPLTLALLALSAAYLPACLRRLQRDHTWSTDGEELHEFLEDGLVSM